MNKRMILGLAFALFLIVSCSGGGKSNTPKEPPQPDELVWDEGHWDEVIWQ
jgi:hypothetical protein